MLPHEFSKPKVTEIPHPVSSIEHDPFIDDLTPAQKVARVMDLNANVIKLDDYRDGQAA